MDRNKLRRLSGIIPAHAGKTRGGDSRRRRQRDHPRSRGENGIARRRPSRTAGSSPLTRGKRDRRFPGCVDAGIIPAHAGKTMTCFSGFTRTRDHPRSRGENFKREWKGQRIEGSSPLTRGKQHLCGVLRPRPRIIPAHAGKTSHPGNSPCTRRDHPRSRGENTLPSCPPTPYAGSSPLTRGKHLRPVPRSPLPGIIPAHAGKTQPARPSPSSSPDHPRSRGENTS